MALEDPEPSFEEKWRQRAETLIATVLTLFLLLLLQYKVLSANLYMGLGFAPLVHFAAFQLVSRLTTGRFFRLRINPKAKQPEDVFDVFFTIAFLSTMLVGCSMTWDTHTYVVPPPPVR